jgi:CRISPR-associated protein Cas1
MIKRTLDISEQAYLHIKNHQLYVEKEGVTVAQVPIEDLGVLILQSKAIVLTQSVLSHCMENNVAVVCCDDRYLPVSVNLPLWTGNTLHTRVLRDQLAASTRTRNRLWKAIVKRKILEQALNLEMRGLATAGLERLARKVRNGDPENMEAQAAKRYWRAMFGADFRRNADEPGINVLLNYGYAVLRAMIARALVGAGLHPSVGLHHSNQYNPLCLADDLMEPLRPWVDAAVSELTNCVDTPQINRDSKTRLLGMLAEQVRFGEKKMPLMVASHLMAADLKRALSESDQALRFPERLLVQH